MPHRHTYADYARLEAFSPLKFEFVDGHVHPMLESEEHFALSGAMFWLLRNRLHRRSWRAHTSDLRIYVEAARLATFPDASVICGPMQRHEPSPDVTALNPAILVEVTSNSSEEYDLGEKREYYQMIPSLREYIIVSHRERRITVYARGGDNSWTSQVVTRGSRFAVPSLETEIAVDDVYANSTIP
jgi:Uma2 family endonuclease